MDDDVSDPLFVDLDQLWFLPRRIVLGEDREGLEMLVGPHWGRTHPRDAKQAKETGEDSDDEKIPVVANLLLEFMFTLVDLNHCQLVLNEDQHKYLHPWKGVPYSRKIWWGIKFGGLYYYKHQIKIHQNFLLAYIRMAILYQTAKFKSANILPIAILGSTAKFNSRQYFQLYGMGHSYNVIM